jgi:lipopolysaccharide/colanic/teichoic acid biosynthesis glycosyltransferase
MMRAVPDSLQRALAVMGAALTLPLVAALALALKLESRGPAIYAAPRVGEGGRRFRIHKLRTMRWEPDGFGPKITVAGDPRITCVGSWLRRFRLDELPQLWDAARGVVRLVGPRPEAPEFVDFDDPVARQVFSARPGITGLAQLMHLDEAERLDGSDPERHYREVVLPAKLRMDLAYLRHRSTRLDLWILAQTPRAVLGLPLTLPAQLRGEELAS